LLGIPFVLGEQKEMLLLVFHPEFNLLFHLFVSIRIVIGIDLAHII